MPHNGKKYGSIEGPDMGEWGREAVALQKTNRVPVADDDRTMQSQY
jgi:hypothetical protein